MTPRTLTFANQLLYKPGIIKRLYPGTQPQQRQLLRHIHPTTWRALRPRVLCAHVNDQHSPS